MSVAHEQTEESEITTYSQRLFDRKEKYLNDQAYGFVCCLISVFWYCISFMCIRLMTDYKSISSDWTLFFKESVMVLVSLFFILWKSRKGPFRFPCRHILGLIVLAAFFCEFLGARPHLWAFAAIGILLASPLVQAFQIIGTTIVGILWFKETISHLKIWAIIILIAAISFLSLGQSGSSTKQPQSTDSSQVSQSDEKSIVSITSKENQSLESSEISQNSNSFQLAWGILTTLITGLGYTFYISLLRGVMKEATQPSIVLQSEILAASPQNSLIQRKSFDYGTSPVAAIMFIMPLVGLMVFGFCLLYERGISGFYQNVPTPCWGIVLSSGLANVLAFFFKIESLRYISGSKMSLVAVTQTLTLVLIGMILFREPVNSFVWLGVVLTIVGVILTGKTK
ncbi:MAG: DMT family transporter [Planctomycetia bacterium]|nr:DMT family transporter [Planctomycetia bacterium]